MEGAANRPLDKQQGDASFPTQGNSNANPEVQDLSSPGNPEGGLTSDVGVKAASKASKDGTLPKGQGAGKAVNYQDMEDTSSVVNQPNSAGVREEYETQDEEEYEELDELSRQTLRSYRDKAANSGMSLQMKASKAHDKVLSTKGETQKQNMDSSEKAHDKLNKRMTGMRRAQYKLVRKEDVEFSGAEEELEEYEELEELSTELKQRAKNKATSLANTAADKNHNMAQKVRTDQANKFQSGIENDIRKNRRKAEKDSLSPAKQRKLGMSEDMSEEDEYAYEEGLFEEDLIALFADDENLTEEFKTKAAEIFEAVVSSRVISEVEAIEVELTEQANAAYAERVEDLVENIDKYLNYVTENWMEENEMAIENGLRNEITESFIKGLQQVFTEHYIEVPEDKYDVLAEMQEKLDTLESDLNEEIQKNINLNEEAVYLKKQNIFSVVSEDLADTEAEKFATLVEDITYTSDESYNNKLKVVKENYFRKTSVNTSADNALEDTVNELVSSDNSIMSKYAKAISKHSKF